MCVLNLLSAPSQVFLSALHATLHNGTFRSIHEAARDSNCKERLRGHDSFFFSPPRSEYPEWKTVFEIQTGSKDNPFAYEKIFFEFLLRHILIIPFKYFSVVTSFMRFDYSSRYQVASQYLIG